jgi:hypothetical protein
VNWIERLFGPGADRGPHVIGPRPTLIMPKAPRTVVPPPRFAWDEKRWRRVPEPGAVHYVGAYRVWDRGQRGWHAFDGRLVEDASGIKAYVADPPKEIKGHPKGPCFQLVQAPWFRVHWRRNPSTVDEALFYVERLLDECLNRPLRGWL